MTDFYLDKVRLVVAKMPDERYPMVVGALPESTWEIIPPEDWDKAKREMAEKWLGPDWTAYDYVEAVALIPNARLADMFETRKIEAVAVEKADVS